MANKQTKRGHRPPFVPTETERAFVAAMAGVRMTWDEICCVLGSARNGADRGKKAGAPIAKTTLAKHFKHELAAGGALLRAKTMGKFYKALDNGESWAVAMSMRNRFGWDPAKYGTLPSLPDVGEVRPLQQIQFIVPGYRPVETEIEVEAETRETPIPGQKLLEPPNPARDTVWPPRGPSGQDWMK